ncbi:MAG TPA: site-2 protease family protein [Candidatus Krumholzibacteria bacterium]|nr:site-2 protease family protein [Candidatus Krumholzibacteria bacterium]HPD70860.1 site-2 protease family protein [Candidatus Krumholzibacteria bacterium]HRY39440.1 site-2 protease family protein [Candidatus Krumholzibacteria bacterium]
MRWSLRLGSFRGIEVSIHVTFLLLLGFLAVNYWLASRSFDAVLAGVGFILLLFGCVLLHEFGHALMAARYGIKTRDIVLYPIGGVARLERMPEDPRQELQVALAGPAVNVVIALALFAWLFLAGSVEPVASLGWASGDFVERLMVVNVVLVVFNLIPAFPMDGGRVLRALLAMRMEYTRATQIAAHIGQALALVFGFVGLFWNPFLLFIAFFVWIGAAQEASMVQMKGALGGIPLQRVMLTEFQTLDAQDQLLRAVQLTLAGSQKDFPVVDAGKLVGVLRQEDMLRGLHEQGPGARVASTMQREFLTANLGEMVESVFRRLGECNCRTLPVTNGRGELVGMVTMENVGEFLRIEAALRR